MSVVEMSTPPAPHIDDCQPIKKKRGRKPKDVKLEVINTKKINIIDSLNITLGNNDASSAEPSCSSTKAIDESKDNTDCTECTEDGQESVTNDVVAPKKGKRGRKPKYVYSVVDTAPQEEQAVTGLSSYDDENIIVRLNINEAGQRTIQESANGIEDEDHPYAYNHDTYTNISNICDEEKEVSTSVCEKKNEAVKVVSILKDFEEKNKNNEWPMPQIPTVRDITEIPQWS
jgi:hypothetical protein